MGLEETVTYLGLCAIWVKTLQPILRVFEQIEKFNDNPRRPVLILGQTGVGKSAIAELIHKHSGRKGEYRRESPGGTYGADDNVWKGLWLGYGKDHGLHGIDRNGGPGILQLYKNGTIFVDEVVDLSDTFQTFLLDVVSGDVLLSLAAGQGEQFAPDVRMVFATNKNIELAIGEGRFRSDLYSRIKDRILQIPPLNNRKEDIFDFVRYVFPRQDPGEPVDGDSESEPVPDHSPRVFPGKKVGLDVLLCLVEHSYDANVRELLAILDVAGTAAKRAKSVTIDHLTLIPQEERDRVRELTADAVTGELVQFLTGVLQNQGFVQGQGLQKRTAEILGFSASKMCRFLNRVLPDVPSETANSK
jgi:transcriptional regulator with PAS, ATPase and Fis domain